VQIRADDLVRPASLAEDLLGLMAMPLWKLLVVQIVDQTDEAPLVLVLTALAGAEPHHRLDRQCMANQRLVLIVFL
jgi:hypothetical protein